LTGVVLDQVHQQLAQRHRLPGPGLADDVAIGGAHELLGERHLLAPRRTCLGHQGRVTWIHGHADCVSN
jgi:hypothetical protein